MKSNKIAARPMSFLSIREIDANGQPCDHLTQCRPNPSLGFKKRSKIAVLILTLEKKSFSDDRFL